MPITRVYTDGTRAQDHTQHNKIHNILKEKGHLVFLDECLFNPVTSSDQLILIVTRTYELKIELESNLFKQSVWQFAHAMEF